MEPVPGKRFPTTRWSLVAQIREGAPEARRMALEELLTKYLPALRTYLVLGRRLSQEDAEDLLQDFIAHKVLEKGLVGRADPEVGKFRTFLRKALDRFLVDRMRRGRAKKRSAGDEAVVLGDQAGLLVAQHEGADVFDVAWARGVLSEALEQMRLQCETLQRSDVWGVFECRLLLPMLRGTKPADYRELVARFDLASPAQASNVLITAKRMFTRSLRSVVGQYTAGEHDIEAEVAELRKILACASD